MDIDFVVLWVDGSDPAWLAEKNRYSPTKIDDSNAANRFRDWGLMKYWFRAVEKFAPWVRKVHFVTWGHLPPFLNTEHPKLNIVRHQDYMPEGTMPTFNSCALEMNVYRIEGLAEHFVYFCDDMFLTRPLKPSTFFSKDGLPCYQFSEIPITFRGNLETWNMQVAHDTGILNKNFDKRKVQKGQIGKFINIRYPVHSNIRSLALKFLFPHVFTGIEVFHCPSPYRKSLFADIWEKEPDLLMETSRHKFRDRTDVSQFLALCWQMASGQFVPRRMKVMNSAATPEAIDRICDEIRSQRNDMICINDPNGEFDFERLSGMIQSAFETILPEKSAFEK